MRNTLLLIWLVLVATWTASIVTLNPEYLNDTNFWLMVMWINILISLNIFASAPILSKYQARNSSKLIGALPSINIIIFFFSLISGSLAFINYFADPKEAIYFYHSYHLVVQILLFGFVAVTCLFLILSAQGAETGARGLPTREDLINKLKNFEILNKEITEKSLLKDKFHELLQYVEYKMPHPSSMNRDKFLILCDEISKLEKKDHKDAENVKTLIDNILQNVRTL
jgi:hypothetical protein